MNNNQLKIFASQCQIETDKIAYDFIKQSEVVELISVFQSKCDFNLYWLYGVSTLITVDSLHFLVKNIHFFNRKIKVDEMLLYDQIIRWLNPKDFNEFKEYAKNAVL